MVVDTSAVVAILRDEAERAQFIEALRADSRRLMSMASLLETTLVIAGDRHEAALEDLDELVQRSGIEAVPFDAHQLHLAREAFVRFGKGRHRAGLNFGDCFAYALAKATGEPLLFKGDDFSKTDLVPAVA
jgi:ribonuclease VapC